ncbi:hypothetical protein GX51_01438 [Blastomyces parvus]|uniref:Uncharacterized protein n=1 Tax=Blastomyces parvus TaxID=2060905 RepID=A0A2B7XH98_9EURO|nr:hypothetical protein GX51_01438 [Blastomyces parvus]
MTIAGGADMALIAERRGGSVQIPKGTSAWAPFLSPSHHASATTDQFAISSLQSARPTPQPSPSLAQGVMARSLPILPFL